jgi:hypothetical protein
LSEQHDSPLDAWTLFQGILAMRVARPQNPVIPATSSPQPMKSGISANLGSAINASNDPDAEIAPMVI